MHRTIKIPTVVGIVLIIALVAVVSILFENLTRRLTTASGSVKPENVTVANVSDTSFTLTWTTNLDATGAVIISSRLWKSNVFYDERDVNRSDAGTKKTLGSYATHSVTVRNLTPDTDYDVRILSNGKSFSGIGATESVRTGPILTPSENILEPAYGIILMSGNDPADGALVYLTLDGGQVLSAISNTQGSWLIPLNLARSGDLTRYLPSLERTDETILVRHGGEETTATADTFNDAPVPTMVMGKTYDFRKQQADAHPNPPLAMDNTAEESKFQEVLGDSSSAPTGPYHVTLTQPQNGSALSSFLPLIAGTGVPEKSVTVTLGINQPFTGSTRVGSDGMWRFTPTKSLGTGKQSVTITTVDATGQPVALTHTFEILKSGTQVLGEATPSGTLTPTPPTAGAATPTPTSFTTPSATPTFAVTPLPTSTLSGEPVPQTGNALPLLVVIMLAGIFVSTGVVLAISR